jgi:hypothetical protein
VGLVAFESRAICVKYNVATNNPLDGGFRIFGNRNKLIGNLAENNGEDGADHGFDIQGNHVEVHSNKATGNFGDGFFLRPGSGYTVLWNRAKKNGRFGIVVAETVATSRALPWATNGCAAPRPARSCCNSKPRTAMAPPIS